MAKFNLEDWPDDASQNNDRIDFSHLGLKHCETCGLRGPHECLDTDVVVRPGPSPMAEMQRYAPGTISIKVRYPSDRNPRRPK